MVTQAGFVKSGTRPCAICFGQYLNHIIGLPKEMKEDSEVAVGRPRHEERKGPASKHIQVSRAVFGWQGKYSSSTRSCRVDE
jgi:hypothetical protein